MLLVKGLVNKNTATPTNNNAAINIKNIGLLTAAHNKSEVLEAEVSTSSLNKASQSGGRIKSPSVDGKKSGSRKTSGWTQVRNRHKNASEK